jgi:hypothetical protein
MPVERRKMKSMSRVLYAHDWRQLDEWVASVDALADLSDDEIVELERMAALQEEPPSHD